MLQLVPATALANRLQAHWCAAYASKTGTENTMHEGRIDSDNSVPCDTVATGVRGFLILLTNLHGIEGAGGWVLVDAGPQDSAGRIQQWAACPARGHGQPVSGRPTLRPRTVLADDRRPHPSDGEYVESSVSADGGRRAGSHPGAHGEAS